MANQQAGLPGSSRCAFCDGKMHQTFSLDENAERSTETAAVYLQISKEHFINLF
jgi:hypothetical protein